MGFDWKIIILSHVRLKSFQWQNLWMFYLLLVSWSTHILICFLFWKFLYLSIVPRFVHMTCTIKNHNDRRNWVFQNLNQLNQLQNDSLYKTIHKAIESSQLNLLNALYKSLNTINPIKLDVSYLIDTFFGGRKVYLFISQSVCIELPQSLFCPPQ